MAWLVIQGGPLAGTKYALKQGVNKVGRRADCDFVVTEGALSAVHCEVLYLNKVARVRDLDSTNGTFIGTEKVKNAILDNGRTLRLGDVVMTYFSGSEDPSLHAVVGVDTTAVRVVVPQAAAVAVEARGPDDCINHAGLIADFICLQCERHWCGECVKILRVSGRTHHSCPQCSGKCIPLAEHKRSLTKQDINFAATVPGAFAHPLRGMAAPVLVVSGGGVGMFSFMMEQQAPVNVLGLVLFCGLGSYLLAFLHRILVDSARGSQGPPALPNLGLWLDDVLSPMLQMISVLLVCYAPALALGFYVNKWMGMGLAAVMTLIYPMATLCVSLAGSLRALNPRLLVSKMMAVPGEYAGACLMFLGILGCSGAMAVTLGVIKIPVVPTAATSLLTIYGLAVGMRILGLMAFTNRSKFGSLD